MKLVLTAKTPLTPASLAVEEITFTYSKTPVEGTAMLRASSPTQVLMSVTLATPSARAVIRTPISAPAATLERAGLSVWMLR